MKSWQGTKREKPLLVSLINLVIKQFLHIEEDTDGLPTEIFTEQCSQMHNDRESTTLRFEVYLL